MQKRDDTVMGRPLMLNLLSLGVFIWSNHNRLCRLHSDFYSDTIVVKSCCEVKTRYLMRSLRQRVR